MSTKILLLVCTLALVNGAVRINNDPSQAPAICAAPGSDGILIAHEDCSKFYKCSRGVPVALDCPNPLLYDPEKQWCDWPENVNCNRGVNKEKEDQGDNSKTVEEICAAESSHGVLVPHEVCSKFYMCSFGKPVAFDCLPPLVYSIEKKYCDWPQSVDCGNRI